MNQQAEPKTKRSLWLQFPFLIVTRKSKIAFFTSLQHLLDAGVPILRSLELLQKQQSSRIMRAVTRKLHGHIKEGESLADSMALYPRIFPLFEIKMVAFAEKTGKLADTFEHINETYQIKGDFIRRLIVGLSYPTFLIFAAIFLVPLIQVLFLGGTREFLIYFAWNMAYFFGFIAGIWCSWKILRQIEWFRYLFHFFLLCLPIVRGTVYKFSRARFANVLKAMYQTGVSIVESMMFAAASCGNDVIGRKIHKKVPRLKDGKTISEVLAETRVFAPMAIGMIESGEESGSLDKMLTKFAEWEQQEAIFAVQMWARILPVIVYLGVMIYIVYLIVTMYRNYLGNVMGVFG